MLDRYAEFGMRRNPKGFRGRIASSAPQLDHLLTSEGVTIVDLSDTYDSAERVDKVARMLDQILEYFQFQEDSEELRLLIVVEEAHLWTAQGMPKEAARFLDSAVRLLRKKGVGVMLVSQKISDFDHMSIRARSAARRMWSRSHGQRSVESVRSVAEKYDTTSHRGSGFVTTAKPQSSL